ncbi:hydrogenase expression/formation protein [Amphibiibacter pelophylacis]|uniref:Hydrogenase expression/formation protein n=1 Tax=Amphibiibacter pelophylacis TaxID=1799477 RepID=A0ACC6P008_9BURK
MSTPTGRFDHLPAFPIPVITDLGPGSHTEDEELDYITMPQGMATYRAPQLPEPEALDGHIPAIEALEAVRAALHAASLGRAAGAVSLRSLARPDLQIVNQALGEGEVSARILPDASGAHTQIQESVYTGVWRVIRWQGDQVVDDCVEVGAVPPSLLEALQADVAQAQRLERLLDTPAPDGVLNATPLLIEIQGQCRDRATLLAAGQTPAAHVINLTLLPMTPLDIAFLDHQLGTGRILILSRGYGNCRITNSLTPDTWRVVYYNSQETVILNSVEITGLPEVVTAAPEDLVDAEARLADVLDWMRSAQSGAVETPA